MQKLITFLLLRILYLPLKYFVKYFLPLFSNVYSYQLLKTFSLGLLEVRFYDLWPAFFKLIKAKTLKDLEELPVLSNMNKTFEITTPFYSTIHVTNRIDLLSYLTMLSLLLKFFYGLCHLFLIYPLRLVLYYITLVVAGYDISVYSAIILSYLSEISFKTLSYLSEFKHLITGVRPASDSEIVLPSDASKWTPEQIERLKLLSDSMKSLGAQTTIESEVGSSSSSSSSSSPALGDNTKPSPTLDDNTKPLNTVDFTESNEEVEGSLFYDENGNLKTSVKYTIAALVCVGLFYGFKWLYLNGYFTDLPDEGNSGRGSGSGGRKGASDAAGASTSYNPHTRTHVPARYNQDSGGVLQRSASTSGSGLESDFGSSSRSRSSASKLVKFSDNTSPYDSDTTVIPSADKGKSVIRENVIRENTLNTETTSSYLSSYISKVKESGFNLYQSAVDNSKNFLDNLRGGEYYTYEDFDLLSGRNLLSSEQATKLIPGYKNQFSILTASAFDGLGVPVKGGFYLKYYDSYGDIPKNTFALGLLSDLDSWPELNSDLILNSVNSPHPYKTWLLLDKKYQDSLSSPLTSSSVYNSPPAGNPPLEKASTPVNTTTPVETGNLGSRSGGDGGRAPWLDRKPKESVTPLNTEDLPTTGWNESPMEKPSTSNTATSLSPAKDVWGASETPSQSPSTKSKPGEIGIILNPATPVNNTPTNSLASPSISEAALDFGASAGENTSSHSKFTANLRKAGAKLFDFGVDTSVKSDSSGPKSAPLPTSRYSFSLGLNPTQVTPKTFNETASLSPPVDGAVDVTVDNTVKSTGDIASSNTGSHFDSPKNESPVVFNTVRGSSGSSGSSPQVVLEQPGLAGKTVLLSASMSDAIANEINDTDVSDIPGFTD